MDAIDHPLLPLSARLHLPLARRSLAAAVLLLLACGSPASAERIGPFLRTVDSRLAAAVMRGRHESPTFRAIVDRLAASDLIVYVSRGAISGDTAASTQLVSATGGYRYVRVTLELDPDSDVGVAMLGHELRHAPFGAVNCQTLRIEIEEVVQRLRIVDESNVRNRNPRNPNLTIRSRRR